MASSRQAMPSDTPRDSGGAAMNDASSGDSSLEPYGPAGTSLAFLLNSFRGIFSSPYVASCAAFAAIGGLLFGYDQGVMSVTLVMDYFLRRFPEVSDDAPGAGFKKGLMTAMITLGAFIGAVNQGWVADWASRKRSIMIAVMIFTIGSSLQTAAVNYDMLVAGRFVGVLASESSIPPPDYSRLTPWLWFFCTSILPRWLAFKGREEESLRTLSKIRRLPETDSRVRKEWIEIVAEARFQASVLSDRHPSLSTFTGLYSKTKLEVLSWLDCFKAGCWRRTLVGAGLMFFQQFIGINALIYYSPTLFGTMGLDLDMQLIMSGILNMIQLFGVATSLWTLDRFGRRPMLLVGTLLTLIPLIIVSVRVGLFSETWPSHRAAGWTSVAFLLFYMLVFGSSWAPIPWAVPAEIFPSSLRAKGVSISTCSTSLLFVWFFVPETMGKTLEEMDVVFGDRRGVDDTAKKDAILRAVQVEKSPGQGTDNAKL
ncbi:hypothetical protein ACCO45_007561 [Purpureocillium lilacinum]|uniref:Uncharacterized protein n=1 Tax=Purpureocillium lilacinum TaxID=33203 RepID=A0ACC4DV14_PURLI